MTTEDDAATIRRKKKFVERYYALDEEDMQALIERAKLHDQKAQEQLLEIFHNFLAKYVTLLYYGKYSLSDQDIRRFIGLFVKDGSVRYYLLRNKLSSSGVQHVNECLRGITYMAQRYGTEEDVDQTVKMAFLQCVSIYKRKGKIPFSGFLYSYFFYVLKKMVDAFLIDQLGRKTFPLIDNEDALDDSSEEMVQGFAPPPVPSVEELVWAQELDEYWVAGDTATAPFDQLTIQERQLLRWRYVEREKSGEIAERITEHPNTIREHYNRIKKKLKEIVAQDLEGLQNW